MLLMRQFYSFNNFNTVILNNKNNGNLKLRLRMCSHYIIQVGNLRNSHGMLKAIKDDCTASKNRKPHAVKLDIKGRDIKDEEQFK